MTNPAHSGVCRSDEMFIQGPTGDLQVRTFCPQEMDTERPIAVVCHPHPLHGGTMNNKVVHTLARSFSDLGLYSVCFNFRGVEQSEGNFDHGVGESEDLLHVIDFFRKRHPHAPIWLAGFSFGAFVALRAHEQAGAERLLLVAPPVRMFDFSEARTVNIPWMVIQGGQDEVVSPEAVKEWLQGQQHPPLLRWMPDAGHFFHGRLNRLRETVERYWGKGLD